MSVNIFLSSFLSFSNSPLLLDSIKHVTFESAVSFKCLEVKISATGGEIILLFSHKARKAVFEKLDLSYF